MCRTFNQKKENHLCRKIHNHLPKTKKRIVFITSNICKKSIPVRHTNANKDDLCDKPNIAYVLNMFVTCDKQNVKYNKTSLSLLRNNFNPSPLP